MSSTRMRGNKLALTFGSPGQNYWADATSVVLDNEESEDDVLTYEDAAGAGNRQYFFTVSAIQSTDPSSFWSYVWENEGQSVAFTYAPHGNEVATAEKPHFIGTCKIGAKPAIGGEASRTNTYTFETRFDIEGAPVLDRGDEESS